MVLLDKIEIIKLKNEINRLKKLPTIATFLDFENQVNKLQRNNVVKREQIEELMQIIGYIMTFIGKDLELDRRNIYNKKFYFETSINPSNNNLIVRGGERKNGFIQ